MSHIKNISGKHHNPKTLRKAIRYCCEEYKTGDGKFIVYFGCSKIDPVGSMIAVKRTHKKETKRQFEESMISITPAGNEYTNEELMKIGAECAEFWFRRGYQCIAVLHLDSDFPHFHIIINSVSFINGAKLDIPLSLYNDYKTNCSRILHNYGLDPIRTPAAKIIDTSPHDFDGDLDFFEDYDTIMADNTACFAEMIKQTPALGYTPAMTEDEEERYRRNPDAPTDNGPNTFDLLNNDAYRDYYYGRSNYVNPYALNWPYPFFEPNARHSFVPVESDYLPEPIVIRESSTKVQDEYCFQNDGVVIRINCSRRYETDIPKGYTESQVRAIVENLPRLSESEKDIHTKRAIATSGKLKDLDIEGRVELDFSETIKFNWSDGTSSTIPRLHLTDGENESTEIIDVPYTEID